MSLLAVTLRPALRLQRLRDPACRCFSSKLPSHSASDAAQRILDSFNGKTVTRRQLLDAHQLQKLSLTLGRRHLNGADVSENPPVIGTPVPPGWHLVYFTPNGLESDLGPDGSDRLFNTPAPFTRRMWAGGRMKWPSAGATEQRALLKVGDEIEERTRLLTATAKRSRSAGEMVLVEVEKEFWGPKGLSLVDQRSWIFRPELTSGSVTELKSLLSAVEGPSRVDDSPSTETGYPSRQFRWSPVGLFRFSALTFNGHMIHYNENWTKRVEGHPAEVVHGPLNLINILDYWRDVHSEEGAFPSEISYKATFPIYAKEPYVIRTVETKDTEGGKIWKIAAQKDGTTCFIADILKGST